MLHAATAISLFLLSNFGKTTTYALDNGVGKTPAMGYNTWNDFRCEGINSDNIKKVADKMHTLGLGELGYDYVNIDDCWSSTTRDTKDGTLIADPEAFPDGIKAVSDYVHGLGFKFGMYTDRGDKTCVGRPGSLHHETQDAQTFASWGVDYLKEDSCYASQNHSIAFAHYGKMREALNATGRHIYFSLCGWQPWYSYPDLDIGYEGGCTLGNSWRIATDCNNWPTIYNAIQINKHLADFACVGGWNDPDMLVGSSPLAAVHITPDQSRTQFSLWSVMAAPLLIGSNILNISDFDLETYTNKEVIAVDQDPLGIQGKPVVDTCPTETLDRLVDIQTRYVELSSRGLEGIQVMDSHPVPACQQVWAKALSDGTIAVLSVNYDSKPSKVCVDFEKDLGIEDGKATYRDLWSSTNYPEATHLCSILGVEGSSATYKVIPASSNQQLHLRQ